jgi:hypothetical protein
MGQNVQSNKATRFHILMITGQESQTGLYVFNNAYIYQVTHIYIVLTGAVGLIQGPFFVFFFTFLCR